MSWTSVPSPGGVPAGKAALTLTATASGLQPQLGQLVGQRASLADDFYFRRSRTLPWTFDHRCYSLLLICYRLKNTVLLIYFRISYSSCVAVGWKDTLLPLIISSQVSPESTVTGPVFAVRCHSSQVGPTVNVSDSNQFGWVIFVFLSVRFSLYMYFKIATIRSQWKRYFDKTCSYLKEKI